MNKKAEKVLKSSETDIGRINRKIEKSVSEIVTGTHGATGKTIRLAREREGLLVSRSVGKKTLSTKW